VEVLLEEGKFV